MNKPMPPGVIVEFVWCCAALVLGVFATASMFYDSWTTGRPDGFVIVGLLLGIVAVYVIMRRRESSGDSGR